MMNGLGRGKSRRRFVGIVGGAVRVAAPHIAVLYLLLHHSNEIGFMDVFQFLYERNRGKFVYSQLLETFE